MADFDDIKRAIREGIKEGVSAANENAGAGDDAAPGGPETKGSVEEIRERIEALKEEQNIHLEISQTAESDYVRRQAAKEVGAASNAIAEQRTKMLRIQLKLGEDITEEDRKFLEQQEQIEAQDKKRIKLRKQVNQLGVDYLKTIGQAVLGHGKIGKMVGKGISGMMKFAKGAKLLKKALDAGAISAQLLTAALGIGIIIAIVGAVIMLVKWIIALAIETRDAAVGFQRMTGASYAMGEQMAVARKELEATGVTMDEMRAQYSALYKSTTVFSMATAAQQKQMAKTGAVLAELGVSASDYAKGIEGAVKNMGISVGDADNVMLEMRAHAMDLGVDVGTLSGQFANATGSLAQFGKDGVKAFKDLSMISKITGMDLNRILDLTGKFDTFEDAAKMAGKLNAALGSNMVNAMDMMMTTDPVERFKMIRKAISETGLSFDEMSYYQKKMYTEMLGFKSEGELAQMMSGDMEGLAGNVGKTSKEYAAARKDAQRWQSTMDILKNTLKSLAPSFALIGQVIKEMMDEFVNSEDGVSRIRESFESMVNQTILPALKEMDLPKLIKEFTEAGGGLDRVATSMESLASSAEAMATIFHLVNGVVKIVGVTVLNLVEGFVLVGSLIANIAEHGFSMTAMSATVDNAFSRLGTRVDMFTGGLQSLKDAFIKRESPSLLEAIGTMPKLLDMMGGAMKYVTNPIDSMTESLSAAKERFIAWKDNFVNTWDELRASVPAKIKEIMNGIGEAFGFDAMGDRIAAGIGKWKKGFDKGITEIKSWLGISSPSAEMEKRVGDPMVQGIVSAFGNLGPELALSAIEALDVLPDWAKSGLSAVGIDIGASKEALSAAITSNAAASSAGATSGGGQQTPYQITVNLQLDRKTLSTEVIDIVGNQAFQATR